MAQKKKGFDLNSLLNAKSKGAAVQETDAGPDASFQIAMIDVEDLLPCRDNFYQTESIDELAEAIELSGIEQNLIVKPKAHGKYEVIAGHRRRLAVLKLVSEGKEEYRKVPCRVKQQSDAIKDRLSLILTNSTARELTDWEKIQQVKELKSLLEEYKKALEAENGERPKEGRVKMGRIREIVAEMLHTSATQIGRMEAVDNHLSQEFKEELQKGKIGISTAHELSRLGEEEQKKAYEQYENKGELHIKDVKQEEVDRMRGQMEIHDFSEYLPEPEKLKTETIEERAQGTEKISGPQKEEACTEENGRVRERTEANHPAAYFPEPEETGLDFTGWIWKKYGMSAYGMIGEEVRKVIKRGLETNKKMCPAEWERELAEKLYDWIRKKTDEYKKYLKS